MFKNHKNVCKISTHNRLAPLITRKKLSPCPLYPKNENFEQKLKRHLFDLVDKSTSGTKPLSYLNDSANRATDVWATGDGGWGLL